MKEYVISVDDTMMRYLGGEPMVVKKAELIRCKDCAHRKRFSSKTSYCDLIGKLHIGERDYCSWAERRKE